MGLTPSQFLAKRVKVSWPIDRLDVGFDVVFSKALKEIQPAFGFNPHLAAHLIRFLALHQIKLKIVLVAAVFGCFCKFRKCSGIQGLPPFLKMETKKQTLISRVCSKHITDCESTGMGNQKMVSIMHLLFYSIRTTVQGGF